MPKMPDSPRTSRKNLKNPEPRKASVGSKDQSSSRKRQRKGENPVRIRPASGLSPDYGNSDSWICKNSACRATLSTDDKFCKRCSCCICKQFDDNKDPSLWLECTSECGNDDSCGLSSHIECALQCGKVGVVDLGQLMQLDGSYCCASCGKVSVILGCWKKQLNIAKDARRLDVLCERIYLSYRLLDGTSRFKELHAIVKDAKAKLETEVGPMNGVSEKMARGIVGRLPIAGEVQKLCALAIEKADKWLAAVSITNTRHREGSLPAAYRFLFEEITSSSVSVVLTEPPTASSAVIKGYKLWYCKSRTETYPREPIYAFPRSQRRMLISNLQPLTEYSFRIVSYTDTGEFGSFEAKCSTRNAEISHKTPSPIVETPKCQWPTFSRELDLNVASMPDLNEEIALSFETTVGEDNKTPVGPAVREDVDAVSHGNKKGLARSKGSGDSSNGEVPAVNSRAALSCKRAVTANEETHDNGNLVNGSPVGITKGLGIMDEDFEYCVKMIRRLEYEGYIEQEFRLKLLTWFSLRSTEHERRVVNTFIQTLIDDPRSLAAQLVDSFSDVVSIKRPRNGFCSKVQP